MRCSVAGLFQRSSMRAKRGNSVNQSIFLNKYLDCRAASRLAMTALYDVQMNLVGYSA